MNNVIIIAEAGVNHNGSLDLAKQLIDIAVWACADFVKFQTFKTELNISKTAVKAEYQEKNTQNIQETQFEMVKKLELSFDDFRELNIYCKRKGIGFLSTGFDLPSIDFLNELGQLFFKIPSGEITNKPFLQHIAKKSKPVIMSTGMATLQEIRDAMKVLIDQGLNKEQISVLHCNTEYPTPMVDVNLKALLTIQNELGVKIGYSDHTNGIEVSIAAVALGATIIEKHFTIDRNLIGPDHSASLEPNELKAMINAIRNIEQAISGNGIKKPSESEIKNINIARKSLHLSEDFEAGHTIMENDLISLRPGDGISPMEINSIIGRKLRNRLYENHKLQWSDLI
jgi:N,N'-diacetyllegionaminate synthase